MSYRYMRILLFFDLPTTSSRYRKEANKFRNFLIKNGFMMLQESVYVKLALNQVVANTMIYNLEKNKPNEGIIQILVITEKQYSNMYMMVGEREDDVLNSTDRIVYI